MHQYEKMCKNKQYLKCLNMQRKYTNAKFAKKIQINRYAQNMQFNICQNTKITSKYISNAK